MATTTASSRSKKPGEESVPDQAKAIVYEAAADDDKDGGKKRYSRGTKDLQVIADGAVEFTDRLAQAVADGVGGYRKKHKASARKKKDGAFRDVVENVNESLSDALETAAKAPRDLSKKVTLKRLTRLVTPQPLNIFFRR